MIMLSWFYSLTTRQSHYRLVSCIAVVVLLLAKDLKIKF